uniref:Uncharacterized protein LOC102808134 n=1 Tax=Saccoglossus kowalevskii TaxID=10224 RepID=A0ABM0M6A1_SACKO|nr:PREDICTED: uncharacterized protein LOC102808134 [Saccoglossus kowalevskii]
MPDVELKPSEIYYLHDSIDCRFQDGTHILDTFRELLYKTINPSLIRKIAVHNTNGKWRAYAGNRRLYIFRRLERLGVVDYITAWQVWRVDPDAWRKRETTQNGGTSVQIRNDPQFNAKINRIINEWRTSTRQVAPRAPIQNLDRNIEMDNVPTNVHTMAATDKWTNTNEHIAESSDYDIPRHHYKTIVKCNCYENTCSLWLRPQAATQEPIQRPDHITLQVNAPDNAYNTIDGNTYVLMLM